MGHSRETSQAYYDSCDCEYRDGIYYFDREPNFFSYLLQYYRTDEMHFPPTACARFLWEELHYWGIPESVIQPCCLSNFKYIHNASVYLVPMEEKIEETMNFREENFINLLNMQHLKFTDKIRCHIRTMTDDVYRTCMSGKVSQT